MSIVGGNPQFFGPPVQQNGIAAGTLNQLFSQGVAPGQAPVALAPADLQRLIGSLFQALQQLGTGWAGFAGGGGPQQAQQNQQLQILQAQAQQSQGLASQAQQLAFSGFAESMGIGATGFSPFGQLQPNLFGGQVAGPTGFSPFGNLNPNLFGGQVAGPTGFSPFGDLNANLFGGQVAGPTGFAPFGNLQPNQFPGTGFGATENFFQNQFGGGFPQTGFPGYQQPQGYGYPQGYGQPPQYGPPQGYGQYGPPQGYGSPGGPWGYRPGMTPVGPANPTGPSNPTQPVITTPEINTNINFKTLSSDQRTNLSNLDDHDRAVLHLWGIQMTSAGKQDGGISFNVASNPNGFKPAERQVAAEFAARDKALFGGVNGKSLDQEFFKVFQKITGEDISAKYANAPPNFATGPVNMDNRLNGNNGMSAFENGVIRLWGHEPLFNGGKIDGSILSYTLNSPNSLDFGLNKQDVQTLLTADLSADGKRDGDSLKFGFGAVLDKLYQGGQGVTAQDVTNHAQTVASQTRPFGTIPPGGNVQQYQQYAQAPGPDLARFDASLNEISALSGTVPQNGNLDGRFENGLFLRYPTDQREFASYLQSQVAGGALNGQTTIRQSDAIPGTRFGQVADPTQWNASVARTYAYQFAAEAAEYGNTAPPGTYNPLSADGLANGAKFFETMSPDARVFTQVASVFKGNLMGGPGNYNNPALKQLLQQKAQQTGDPELTRLAGQANVGQTDVQTIGAITNALNSGKITLNDIMASGAIAPQDMNRYTNIIGYVQNGQFNQDLGHFDANPIRDGNGNPIPNTGSAGNSQNTGASPNASQGGVGGVNGLYNSFNGPNPHQGRLDELKADPVVRGFYAMLDLNGDGKVAGPETAAATSNLNDLINLMMSGAKPGPNAPAAVQQFFNAHDFDKDGRYSVDEVRQSMKDLAPVLESIKLDQYSNGANAGKPVAYGPPPGINPNGNIANCPVLGKMVNKQ